VLLLLVSLLTVIRIMFLMHKQLYKIYLDKLLEIFKNTFATRKFLNCIKHESLQRIMNYAMPIWKF